MYRRNLFEYDQVVNTQRDKVYAERRRALQAADLRPLMLEYAERTADDILEVGCCWLGGWLGWLGWLVPHPCCATGYPYHQNPGSCLYLCMRSGSCLQLKKNRGCTTALCCWTATLY